MWALAQTLDRITPWLSPAIARGAGFAQVAAVARRLPAQLTNCVFLELWLPDGASRVDMIVRVDSRGRALLIDPSPHALDPALRDAPAWKRIIAFAREWAIAGGPLEQAIEGTWLEFDLEPAATATVSGSAALRPRLFIDFTAEAQAWPSVDARLDLARRALRPVMARDDPRAVREIEEQLRTCFGYLPAGARIPYLGLAPGVRSSAIRVCVTGLGGALPAYLAALGWPGDAEDLAARVLVPVGSTLAAPPRDVSVVHLDLTPEVAPRIGLEYAFGRVSQRQGQLRELAFVRHLVSRGWCSDTIAEALPRWPGRSAELLAHEIWQSRVARRVSHVKLTYATGQPLEAKAYLCFFHELLRGGTLLGSHARFAHAPAAASPY